MQLELFPHPPQTQHCYVATLASFNLNIMLFDTRHKAQLALLLGLLLLWSTWMLLASTTANLNVSKISLELLDDLLDLVQPSPQGSNSDSITLVPLPPGLDHTA